MDREYDRLLLQLAIIIVGIAWGAVLVAICSDEVRHDASRPVNMSIAQPGEFAA